MSPSLPLKQTDKTGLSDIRKGGVNPALPYKHISKYNKCHKINNQEMNLIRLINQGRAG
jgi:hypothetical protein